MIRGVKAWCTAPSESVTEALPLLRWTRRGERSAAGETAALMVYIALLLMSDEENEEVVLPRSALLEILGPRTVWQTRQVAHASYDALQKATGLSRTSISAGIVRLTELQLIEVLGSHQKRRYVIVAKGNTARWFKVPCMPIVRNQEIFPFANFTLRSRHELNALKLYLYLAARRPNNLQFTAVTYEKIFERTGISERDIRKASSFLVTSGLMRGVDREVDSARKVYGANHYYLTGSDKLPGYESAAARSVEG